jgi:hydrogenase/urease accessory protein HupE
MRRIVRYRLRIARPLLLALTLVGTQAGAHPLAPALLDIQESRDGHAEVSWKTSRLRAPGATVEPVLPPECRVATPPVTTGDATSMTLRWRISCEPVGLVGKRIGIEGLAAAKIDALVRITLADGRLVQRVLRSRQPFMTIPERPQLLAVVRDYVGLGVAHILTGPDHLLFVFGLLLLVSTLRLLVQTITAFTVGHSITLSLAVLEMANVPSGPTEVLIALSVLVLAIELARETPWPTLMRRFPWAMAIVFGLLHGLGFAGALREVGLPSGDIPVALFSFNVGIELGQLLFVLVVLGTRWVLGGLPSRLPRWVQWVPVYAIGSLAAFWCFERSAPLLWR